jgi:hypothetical protein
MVIVGWNFFWCRALDAAGTKVIGAGMLFGCLSAFLGLVLGTLDVSGKPFRAGGYAGEFLAHELSDYLNRTGAVIVVLTLIVLSTIMSTQFSFGRFFAVMIGAVHGGGMRGIDAFRAWREERRREKQRREVIAKHTKKGTASPAVLAEATAPRPAPAISEASIGRAAKGAAADTPAARAKNALARAFSRSKDKPAIRSRSRRPSRPRWSHPRCRCPTRSRCPRRRPSAARANTCCRRSRCSTR